LPDCRNTVEFTAKERYEKKTAKAILEASGRLCKSLQILNSSTCSNEFEKIRIHAFFRAANRKHIFSNAVHAEAVYAFRLPLTS